MEWITADKENIPNREVLTRNFTPKTYGYGEYLIGWLDYNSDQKFFECENDYQLLENITEFMFLEPPTN